MVNLKILHYWFGVFGIIIFLLTGQYMHHFYNHLEGMQDGMRMVFRSGHIYFLMASIMNLITGCYLVPLEEKYKIVLQYISSLLILVSPLLILWGFFTEAHLQDLQRPFSRYGIYVLFGSAILFSIIGFTKFNNNKNE